MHLKNSFVLIIFFLLIFSCQNSKPLGKAIISEIEYKEIESFYYPHSCKDQNTDSNLFFSSVSLNNNNDFLLIKNSGSDGFTGHNVEINLNKELEVVSAIYNQAIADVDNKTEESLTFKVDSLDLTLNENPFKSKSNIGFYTLYLSANYQAGKLRFQREKDTIFQHTFKGKFKSCSN